MDAEALVDLLEVLPHRPRGDSERGGDLGVRLTEADASEDDLLSRSEAVEAHVCFAEQQDEQVS